EERLHHDLLRVMRGWVHMEGADFGMGDIHAAASGSHQGGSEAEAREGSIASHMIGVSYLRAPPSLGHEPLGRARGEITRAGDMQKMVRRPGPLRIQCTECFPRKTGKLPHARAHIGAREPGRLRRINRPLFRRKEYITAFEMP